MKNNVKKLKQNQVQLNLGLELKALIQPPVIEWHFIQKSLIRSDLRLKAEESIQSCTMGTPKSQLKTQLTHMCRCLLQGKRKLLKVLRCSG